MNRILPAALLLAALAGCTTVPTGPSVTVLPGTGMSFERFRADDLDCRGYALAQVGGTSAQSAADQSILKSAGAGAAIGAVAGAAMGGHEGAGTGAGVGLAVGTLAGVSAADSSSYGSQRRYDRSYIQCMYAKGHRVPVYGRLESTVPSPPPPPPPPPAAPPPR